MALVPWTARTEGDVALVAATAKTVLQIVAPTNICEALLSYCITFKGVSPTETPILVELVHQSTAGTSSAGTPRKDSARPETLQVTSRITFTVEPITDFVMREYLFHPQGGFERAIDWGQVACEGGARIGLRVTSPQTATCRAFISGEE